jgi:hypothetical protein
VFDRFFFFLCCFVKKKIYKKYLLEVFLFKDYFKNFIFTFCVLIFLPFFFPFTKKYTLFFVFVVVVVDFSKSRSIRQKKIMFIETTFFNKKDKNKTFVLLCVCVLFFRSFLLFKKNKIKI